MPTLELLKTLIRCPSVTPNDAGCQDIISERLKQIGFNIEFMHFGEVKNLWARYGAHAPLMVFAGHTDVVPPGPLDQWSHDPFLPHEEKGMLYGRGAADMKSGLSAMIIAAEQFIQQHPNFPGSIGFLITSDEEGPSLNGTRRVMDELNSRVEMIDYCIVGEATSEQSVGDQIRVGRRGSLSGRLTILGKQGHVAFPHLARNPIHLAAGALQELTSQEWDKGDELFPATSFQISNIQAGTGANNVIPGALTLSFNFRFGTSLTVPKIQAAVEAILAKHGLEFDLEWDHSASPFLTKRGKLIAATQQAIKTVMQIEPVLSTGGGTSDARFISPTGAEVLELGPCNHSVHQINEHVRISDLDKLTKIYALVLENIFS